MLGSVELLVNVHNDIDSGVLSDGNVIECKDKTGNCLAHLQYQCYLGREAFTFAACHYCLDCNKLH